MSALELLCRAELASRLVSCLSCLFLILCNAVPALRCFVAVVGDVVHCNSRVVFPGTHDLEIGLSLLFLYSLCLLMRCALISSILVDMVDQSNVWWLCVVDALFWVAGLPWFAIIVYLLAFVSILRYVYRFCDVSYPPLTARALGSVRS